jgi:hypothetical protein
MKNQTAHMLSLFGEKKTLCGKTNASEYVENTTESRIVDQVTCLKCKYIIEHNQTVIENRTGKAREV